MDVIILAGGRGRRMGALSAQKNKGALNFNGRSIIAQIIDTMLIADGIETIWIATGYRGEDVKQAVELGFKEFVSSKKIKVIDAPHISGELPRFLHVTGYMGGHCDCLVRGIDTLLPDTALNKMISMAQYLVGSAAIISASRLLEVAPTHHRVHLRGDIVESYDPPEHGLGENDIRLHTDVGMRFFPASVVREMSNLHVPAGCDFIDGYLKSAVEQGRPVRAAVFKERWRHFSSGHDFLK